MKEIHGFQCRPVSAPDKHLHSPIRRPPSGHAGAKARSGHAEGIRLSVMNCLWAFWPKPIHGPEMGENNGH